MQKRYFSPDSSLGVRLVVPRPLDTVRVPDQSQTVSVYD